MRNSELGMRNNVRVVFLSIFLLIFLLIAPALVRAEEKGGLKTAADLQIQVSTRPEAQARFNMRFIFPFLQGSGPLTKDNNITAVLSADISPVSLNGIGEVTWQPAAFFLLSGGGRAGSGWNMPLGYGIGINAPEDTSAPVPRKSKIYGDAFDGLLWGAWGAGTLQFDLGAVIPGDWTHVLFQTRQEFRYAAYTRAASGQAWVFENDDKENQNGWVYYASYVLGYQMPNSPVLDTVALMAELYKNFYDTPGGAYWGDSLGAWIFSGIFNFTINPRFSTALIIQMRTRRNYGTKNYDNSEYYYQDLALQDEGGQRRVIFYRAAAILSYKLW